jgi:hypothetical protein
LVADVPRAGEATAWWQLYHQELQPGQHVILPMLTGSMLPVLPVGSVIEITGVRGRECRRGDVVVFRQDDRLVAHRLLVRLSVAGRGGFLQAGDSISRPGWIGPDVIVGLVTAVRLAGGERRDLRTPAALHDGRRRAARRFLRLATGPLWSAARKVKAWCTHSGTDSTGSG